MHSSIIFRTSSSRIPLLSWF